MMTQYPASPDVFASCAGHEMERDISYYPVIRLLDWQKLKELGVTDDKTD